MFPLSSTVSPAVQIPTRLRLSALVSNPFAGDSTKGGSGMLLTGGATKAKVLSPIGLAPGIPHEANSTEQDTNRELIRALRDGFPHLID